MDMRDELVNIRHQERRSQPGAAELERVKWTPSAAHLARFVSWKLGRSDLVNPSRCTKLLLPL